jgi:hypothetical protein
MEFYEKEQNLCPRFLTQPNFDPEKRKKVAQTKMGGTTG